MQRRRGVRFMAGAALLMAACASHPASMTVPLEIPEPPPRVAMDPVPAVLETPATPVTPERPSTAPVSRPAGPAVPPPASATATPSATPPPAVTTAEPVRPTPPPELRPAGPAGRTPNAAQVRDSIVRTKQKLDAIDRRRLNAGKRSDYDSARLFLVQAESAVKDNNLLLAESSVGKAETLADGLR